MAGIGDLMNPGGQPGQEPEPGSWSDLVKDPIARSALLGFGLQAMTGGWGNGSQQIAAALGAGATSGAATSEAMRQQMEKDDQADVAASNRAATLASQEANRKNQLDIAKLNADSRSEVANIRTAAMLDRTRMNLAGKATANDAIKYRTEARKVIEGNPQNMALSQQDREYMIEDLATRMYDADAARRGTGTPGATSAKTPGAPTAPGPGQSPGAQTPGKPPAQIGTSNDAINSALERPDIKQLMKTPEGRQELLRRNPIAGKMLIDRYKTYHGGSFEGPDQMIWQSDMGLKKD